MFGNLIRFIMILIGFGCFYLAAKAGSIIPVVIGAILLSLFKTEQYYWKE